MTTRQLIAGWACLVFACAALGAGKLSVTVQALSHKDMKPPKVDEYSGLPVDPKGAARVDYKKLGDIVVYAEAVGVPDASKPLDAALAAKLPEPGKSPPLVLGSVGGELSIKNATDKVQTFYSMADGNSFRLEALKPGETRKAPLAAAGDFDLLIESSDDPVAHIFVAPTARARLATAGDTVEWKDVPPGEYRVTTWHPRLPGITRAVKLEDLKTAKLTVSVGVREADLPRQ